MHITYHVLIKDTDLSKLGEWEKTCQAIGFDVVMDSEELQKNISRAYTELNVNYRGKEIIVKINTSPVSDVADICDELRQHITEEQNISVNVVFNMDTIEPYGVTVIVLVLTHMLNGVTYIEGDGVFITSSEALSKAHSEYKYS